MRNRFGSLVFGMMVAASTWAVAACEGDTANVATTGDAGTTGSFDATPPDAGAPAPAADAPPDAGSPTEDAAPPQLSFFTDFESGIPAEITPGTGIVTPTQGYAPLGPPGRTFGPNFLRSETANVVKISFANLPPHTTVSLGFLFAAIDSLDGTGTFPAGDFFNIKIDGKSIFRESFANATDDQIQSYVPPSGGELARKVDLGFQGPGGYYRDSAYDMSVEPRLQNLPHTASTLTIEMTIEGEGTQTLDDESWAIDDLKVTTAK